MEKTFTNPNGREALLHPRPRDMGQPRTTPHHGNISSVKNITHTKNSHAITSAIGSAHHGASTHRSLLLTGNHTEDSIFVSGGTLYGLPVKWQPKSNAFVKFPGIPNRDTETQREAKPVHFSIGERFGPREPHSTRRPAPRQPCL